MSQHLVREVQQLKQEVALLKEMVSDLKKQADLNQKLIREKLQE